MVSLIPFPLFILGLQNGLKIIPQADVDDGTAFFIFNCAFIPVLFFGFIFYELIKRKSNTQIFDIKNVSILFTLTYPFLGTAFATFFGTIPMFLAGLSLKKNKIIYTVAPKNIENISK